MSRTQLGEDANVAVSARGVSAIPSSSAVNGDSDGWDSDGSQDSVFSIDDHHLPWEVTEKLLLAENSDIQLVAPKMSRSIWPSPNPISRRKGTTSASSSASLFAYLPLAPLPQTVHAAEAIAEKIAENKRLNRLVVRNRFRTGPRKMRKDGKVKDKSSTTGRENGYHESKISSYAIPPGIRVTGCRKLPHNVIRHSNSGMVHLPHGTGLNLVPLQPFEHQHGKSRLPSRTVSAPTIHGKRPRFSSHIVMRERNVKIGNRNINSDLTGMNRDSTCSSFVSNEKAQNSTSTDFDSELPSMGSALVAETESRRPQTAPRERSDVTSFAAARQNEKVRPASARRHHKKDIGKISEFQLSTEIKHGLLSLSMPQNYASSYGPSFSVGNRVANAGLDVYSLPTGISVTSSSTLVSPQITPRSALIRTPQTGQGQLNPWHAVMGQPGPGKGQTPTSSSGGRSKSRDVRSRKGTSRASSSKQARNGARNTSTSKKKKHVSTLKGTPAVKNSNLDIVPSETNQATTSAGMISEPMASKQVSVTSLDIEHIAQPHSTLVLKKPKSIPSPCIDVRRSINGSHKPPVIQAGSFGNTLKASLTPPGTMPGNGDSDPKGHPKSKEDNVYNVKDSDVDLDEDLIQLYPQDTMGSAHVVFKQDEATTNAPQSNASDVQGKQHYVDRDPTIKLTNPGRLPKWMLRRSRDSLFCPKNMLFEGRKKRQSAGSLQKMPGKTFSGVSAIGTHFEGHDAAMKARSDQAKAKAKQRASIARKARKARRAREKKILGAAGSRSRPSSATSTKSRASSCSVATNNSASVVARIKAANTSAPPPPPGWQEHLDLQTGRVFYLELSTGKTTWENPSRSRPRRVESRGMIMPTGVQLHTPPIATRIKQDWREYLPHPE